MLTCHLVAFAQTTL